jgi:hypothetical protein
VAGRRLLSVANVLIPPVLGLAIETQSDTLLPGLGMLAGPVVTKIAENGREWLGRTLHSRDWGESTPIPDPADEGYLAPAEALEAHLALAADHLGQVALVVPDISGQRMLSWPEPVEAQAVDVPAGIYAALRHTERIAELCVDHNATADLARAAADMRDALMEATRYLGDQVGIRSQRQDMKLQAALHEARIAIGRAYIADGELADPDQPGCHHTAGAEPPAAIQIQPDWVLHQAVADDPPTVVTPESNQPLNADAAGRSQASEDDE